MKYILTLFFITTSYFNAFSQDNLYNPKDSNLLNKIIDSLDKNYNDESYEKLLGIGMKARRFLKNSNNLYYANILKQEGFHGVTVNTTQTDPLSPFQIDPLKTDVTFHHHWV